MNILAILMPLTAAIGAVIVVIVLICCVTMIKKEQSRNASYDQFIGFLEGIRQENEQMQKDIQIIREKVESMDKLMKDI